MATVVKCDNPRCNAYYEVSSFLGGHTFTCNACGSRVTVRDLSAARGSQRTGQQGNPDKLVYGFLLLVGLILVLAFIYVSLE